MFEFPKEFADLVLFFRLVQTYSLPELGVLLVRSLCMPKPFLQCHRRFKNRKDHCYWSIAEKVRTSRGWVQRHLLYLGEINDSQKEAWTKVINVFDPLSQQTTELALYPAGRSIPEHASSYGVNVPSGPV